MNFFRHQKYLILYWIKKKAYISEKKNSALFTYSDLPGWFVITQIILKVNACIEIEFLKNHIGTWNCKCYPLTLEDISIKNTKLSKLRRLYLIRAVHAVGLTWLVRTHHINSEHFYRLPIPDVRFIQVDQSHGHRDH